MVCGETKKAEEIIMRPECKFYGRTKQGDDVLQFSLENKNGLVVRCLNYGCRLTHLLLPFASGYEDILLGYDSLDEYEADSFFLGALVGRYANRIRGASFDLSGKKYALQKNDGENYLHGNFHRRVFEAEVAGESGVLFSYASPAGEDGFPGRLDVRVIYSLDDENRLTVDCRAATDADTHVNLTTHPYFDLSAGKDDTIEGQVLQLNARRFVEIDADLCPTGRLIETEGGPFDFSRPKPIGRDIESNDVQLKRADGYDHCFAVAGDGTEGLALAAEASDAAGKRRLSVFTTQPGVQFYTGNFLSGKGKGRIFNRRSGFCLETQHYPDSPNHPGFPSTLLSPGEEYHEKTVLQFSF